MANKSKKIEEPSLIENASWKDIILATLITITFVIQSFGFLFGVIEGHTEHIEYVDCGPNSIGAYMAPTFYLGCQLMKPRFKEKRDE